MPFRGFLPPIAMTLLFAGFVAVTAPPRSENPSVHPDVDDPPDQATKADNPVTKRILPGESFRVAGRPAFILWPPEDRRRTPRPWVLHAPTLPPYPDQHEKWMHELFLDAAVAVAGIDVVESYGSPAAGISSPPCIANSPRNAASRPASACSVAAAEASGTRAGWRTIRTGLPWPGEGGPDLRVDPAQLGERLPELDPIERVGVLAEHRIPVFLIHSDEVRVVPLGPNSGALVSRYREAGAGDFVTLGVAEGKEHNLWEGFFYCKPLIAFTIERARAGAER